jgi:hypothetical protein
VQVQITPILIADAEAEVDPVPVAPLPVDPVDELLPDEQAAMISAADRAATVRTMVPALGLPAEGRPNIAFIFLVRSSQNIFDVDVIC